ncbi:MAG: hypothetical protein U0441_33945 [Polyangiaceae bacterium]
MYRDQAESHQQRIERLERELNLAYQEHNPTSDDAEIGLALLRFRAQRLAKDIDAFREKHHKEPLLRRLGKRARAFGQSRFGKSLAVVGAFTFGMGLHAHLAPKPPPMDEETARTVEQMQEDIRDSSGAMAPPATPPEPSDTPSPGAPSDTTTSNEPGTYHMHCPGSDSPSDKEPRQAFSMKDYKELMARTQAFFHAVRKHDSAALAGMAHPQKDLVLSDENIQLSAAQLGDCFTSSHTHLVSVSAASDDTKPQTCAEIFQAYIDTPYERSSDVMFNEVPDLSGFSPTSTAAPFVFLYLPPRNDEEPSWQGVQLLFERYDGGFVLTGIQKAYWSP